MEIKLTELNLFRWQYSIEKKSMKKHNLGDVTVDESEFQKGDNYFIPEIQKELITRIL